jgi:SulP family sulfate permease
VYEIDGPCFFGAAGKFKETLGTVAEPPRVLILRLSHVMTIENSLSGSVDEAMEQAQAREYLRPQADSPAA